MLFQLIGGVFWFVPDENAAQAAYLSLTPNADLSIAGPYDTAASGAANWGISAGMGNTSREFITIGQRYRIRQSGNITRIRLYAAQQLDLSGFYLKIWRKDGTTYDLVGTSENLISQFTYGDFFTIDLATPIAVQEGDYYGYRLENSGGGGYYLYAKTGVASVASYYVNNATPSATDYDWSAGAVGNGTVLPIELYMQSPQVAFIGDSIIAGHPAHYNFLEATATTNIASTIERQFGTLTNYTYQNMGIGSQTTTQIAARFNADIVALHPRAVVMDGGVNDIAGGSITKATFLANWTAMLNACRDNNIIPLVIPIMPWTNGNTTQMATRDDWNVSLVALVETYEDAIVVDMSVAVGQYAADGPAGNLWDIKTAYNADGVHFNTAGHGAVAAALAAALEESADHLTVTGTTTQTVGQAQTLTLQAINNFGNTYAGYTGDKTIILSGATASGAFTPTFTDKNGAEVNFGSSGTLTFANGVATTSVNLYKAENAEIEATDGTYGTAGSSAYDLDVAVSAGALASFTATYPATVTSGTAFALTLAAKDAYGNTATAVANPVTLSADYGTLSVSSMEAAQFTDDGLYAGNITLFGLSQDRTVVLTIGSGAVSSTASLSVIGVSGAAFIAPPKPDVSRITLTASSAGILEVENLPANIREIALSFTPDFADVSWEPLDREGFQAQDEAGRTVYVKFRTDQGAVSEVVVYEPQNTAAVAIQDGDIIQCKNSSDPFAVYIVKIMNGKKYIRHIVSLAIFNHYPHLKWGNLIEVESLDGFILSGWVRVNTGANGVPGPDDKVWEINGDQTRHWINMTAEEFLLHGGSEDATYNINQGELNLYKVGPTVKLK